MQPFFSPDSRWVAFSADGKLKKVLVSGGVPVTICAFQGTSVSGTWGDDGMIVFGSSDAGGGFQIVSAEGGIAQKVDAGNEPYRWPHYLPGAHALLATVRRENRFDIDLIHMDTHKVENLVRDGSWARYVPNGHILYAQYNSGGDASGFTGGLLAFPFDLKNLRRTGATEPVLQGVGVGTAGAGFYDISSNGTLVYVPGGPEVQQSMEMMWLNAEGKTVSAGIPPNHFHDVHLSPDGKIAAFGLPLSTDIYTYDFSRKTMQRLTFDKHSQTPIFTADGKHILYATNASGLQEIWSKAADGSGQAVRVVRSDFTPMPSAVSPDDKTLAYTERHNDTLYDVYFASLQGDPAPHPFVNSKASEGQARFSPDGKFVAYTSNESGENQVYVRSLQPSGGVWQVSIVSSSLPQWSRDGKKLYFVSDGSKLQVANVSYANGSFASETPRDVFESADFAHARYDVAPDGRILFAVSAASASKLSVLHVIENFDTQLSRTRTAAPQQ